VEPGIFHNESTHIHVFYSGELASFLAVEESLACRPVVEGVSHVKVLSSFELNGLPALELDEIVLADLIAVNLHISIGDFDRFETLLQEHRVSISFISDFNLHPDLNVANTILAVSIMPETVDLHVFLGLEANSLIICPNPLMGVGDMLGESAEPPYSFRFHFGIIT
jgi:hypothetical protein